MRCKRLKFSLLWPLLAASIAVAAYAPGVRAADDPARQLDSLSRNISSKLSRALVRVKLDEATSVDKLLPPEWQKDYEAYREKTIAQRREANGRGGAVIIGRGERAGGAGAPAANRAVPNPAILRKWLQDRADQAEATGDAVTAVRARAILLRLEALRNGISEINGYVIDHNGTALVMASLIVDPAERQTAEFKCILNDGTATTAKVIGSDPVRNISVIKLARAPADVVPIAAAPPGPGDSVIGISAVSSATGWAIVPQSAGHGGADGERAFALPGSETGPVYLFNTSGELAGIGMDHHAIAIGVLKNAIAAMTSDGVLPRRQLGVKWVAVTADDRLANKKLGTRPAVRVDDVLENLPAQKAGLQKGDYLLTIDQIPVVPAQMNHIEAELAGQNGPVKVGVLRGDEEKTVELLFDPTRPGRGIASPPTQPRAGRGAR